jgi:hypothetical protein
MSNTSELSTRSRIGLVIYGMTNAVLFGIGLILLLSIESFSRHLWIGIPIVVVASALLAWPISVLIAPRLRKPLWRRRQLADAGAPVGTPKERCELSTNE